MKATIKLTLVLAASIAAILVGCTTANPAYTPVPAGQPNTNTVPSVIPNPIINTYSNTLAQIAGAVAPANPYAGITSWAITGIFGVLGSISAYVAKQKSGALNSMAQAVVQSGTHAPVLDAAGNTPHFVAIADAINNNLGANQTLNATSPPKV